MQEYITRPPIETPEHTRMLEETNEQFYNIGNLPLADQQDWEKRMIYRVFLRSAYPPAIWRLNEWQTIHLGLINEMSLFPQKALQKGIKFECTASLLDVNRPCTELTGLRVEMRPLTEDERRWMTGISDLSWPGFSGGRGACSLRVVQTGDGNDMPDQFLLKIGIARGENEDALFVLPLIIGPFKVTQGEVHLTGEEVLCFHRQLTLPESGSLTIRESPEIAIPGKIWDSALFATRGALNILLQTCTSRRPVVLDLSAGTGVCGLWMAIMLKRHFDQARVILTDLEEAMPVMRTNVDLNQYLLDRDITVDVQVLRWGNPQHVRELEEIDIVIACDLIYEAELLPALVKTFNALTTEGRTNIIIGYKQRGLSKEEKGHLWTTLATNFEIEKMAPVVGSMERLCKSDAVGVELWRLWKKKKKIDTVKH